jgi:NitT/TauT family transport system substrate-binding protein
MTPDPAGSLARARRGPVRTRCLIAVAAGITLLLAAGCSGGGNGTTAVSGTITIAAVPGVDDAPLWLAQTNQLFSAAGLTVKINTVSSNAAAVAEVADGQADIASSDYGNILAYQAANGSNNPLYLLADGYDAGTGTAEILVRPGGITSPAKLKTIGIPSQDTIATKNAAPTNGDPVTTVGGGLPSSLDALAASAQISDYLLDAPLTLRWKALPEPQEISELQSGQLPAVLLTQPYVYQAEATYGDVELTDVFTGQTAGLPLSGYVARSSWAKQNPAAVADFRSALDNAQTAASSVGPIQQTLQAPPISMIRADADMVSLGSYPTVTLGLEIARVALLMKDADIVTADANSLMTLPGK